MRRYLIAVWMICGGLAWLLTACSAISTGTDPTPTPTPEVTPEGMSISAGFHSVSPQACLLRELDTISVFSDQGDLLAWAPDGEHLAYLGPQENTRACLGSLSVISAPDFKEQLNLEENVSGNLKWSPDSKQLAFVALRGSEAQYTVGISQADGSGHFDLFSNTAVKTDEWSSQKAVLGWEDQDHLDVLASCGSSCQQIMRFDVRTQTVEEVAPSEIKLSEALSIWGQPEGEATATPVVLPTSIPARDEVAASPKGDPVAYVDGNGLLWILSLKEHTQYPIDLGRFEVREVKWSPEGDMLAVRTDYKVLIYAIGCQGETGTNEAGN